MPPPIDPDQGWDLATVRRPERYLGNLVLRPALWRRFDEVVEFPLPTVREIRMLLGRGLKHVKSEPLPIDEMGTQLRGLPHAAVEATAWTAIRIAVRDNRNAVSVEDLTAAVAATKRRRW